MSQVRRLDRVSVRVDARALRNAQRVASQSGVPLTDLVDALVWSVVDSRPMEQLVDAAEHSTAEQAAQRRRPRRPADVIPITRSRRLGARGTDRSSLAALRAHAASVCDHARQARRHAVSAREAAVAVRVRADAALRSMDPRS